LVHPTKRYDLPTKQNHSPTNRSFQYAADHASLSGTVRISLAKGRCSSLVHAILDKYLKKETDGLGLENHDKHQARLEKLNVRFLQAFGEMERDPTTKRNFIVLFENWRNRRMDGNRRYASPVPRDDEHNLVVSPTYFSKTMGSVGSSPHSGGAIRVPDLSSEHVHTVGPLHPSFGGKTELHAHRRTISMPDWLPTIPKLGPLTLDPSPSAEDPR